MGDIVAALRRFAYPGSGSRDILNGRGGLMKEAAVEIERLRAGLDQLRLDICEHATDTVWVGDGETGVDRISLILGDGDWYNEVYLKEP